VIGGVITSTLLTLLVIPTVYEILHEWRAAFFKLLGLGRAAHAAPAPSGPTPEREPA